jgi:hypothetical protein
MITLSSRLRASGTFGKLFNDFFPANAFDKDHILSYISACNEAILNEGTGAYPDHKIQFINPVFVIDGTIYPPAVLHGNEHVISLAHANIELIRGQEVLPVSIPVINSKIPGVCLYMGAGVAYKGYPSLDLNSLTSMPLPFTNKSSEAAMIAMVEIMPVSAEALPAIFHSLAEALGVSAIDDKIKLAKNLLLYKYFFKGVSDSPAYLSFMSSEAATHSFFDCLFTVVSERAFTEAQLDDFRKVIADMTAPLEQYYTNSQERPNNDKKAALVQRELLNSLRGTPLEQTEKKLR